MTDTRKWSAIAAVLVVAIFAAGWFLLISPKRSDAAALRTTAASKASANAQLEDQIKMLQEQQKDLPQQQATLAGLRNRIPNNPALPSLVRDLTEAGRKAGISIDSMTPSVPVAAVAAAPVAPVADSTTDSGSTGTKTKTKAAPAAPSQTLFQIPMTVNVTGSYFELEQFVSRLENVKRSFLISGFTLSDGTGENAVEGDLTIVLNGRVFLTQETAATTTTPVAPPAATGDQGATS
jgi:type IV pilus assembly protein PilO